MESIIQVTHLSKIFQEVTAVSDLSFTVRKGDVYGFLGQNGAGKSTTIRMLLTLITPSEGEIEIFGYKLNQHRKEILSNTGAVIERPDLYKYLTAFETLQLFAKMSSVKRSREQLMNQLELVGLAQRAHSKVRTFSQGMKQRLGIAVALVHDPKLIILDEPTNGLDPQGIADMRNLILRLSKEMKKTVIISSHLLSEVEQIANRMIIIDRGKKIVEGSVEQLLDPEHTVVDIDTTSNEATQQLLASSKWNGYIQPGKPLQLMMNKTQVPALINDLVAGNVQVLSVKASHSLENYFLSLTTRNEHVEAIAN
jgi:ABC-type multidrug transport system ATPase subunit